MADEIEKKISIKWSNKNVAQMTREMETYDRATHKLTTSYQKFDQINKNWVTNKEVTKSATGQMGLYGNALNSVMMRFIGVNAIIGLAQRGFHELQKWVGESVQSFRSFEYRMAEVSSILTTTTRDVLPSLEIGISTLSKTYGKSVDDLTKGLYEIISAAFDVEDAMSLLNVVTKASIAGLTTVEGAVRTFTGVLNAYGMSTAHASKLSDELFEAVVRGNFTFSQLESSLGYVVPIAAEAGIAFEEIASAMTTATRQGQHIDSVTRGLGLLIQNIINPTKEAAEAAKEYGVDMTATALRVNGLTGFLEQLSTATQKYGSQILPELIGNMRSLRVVMALTSDSGIKGFIEDMDLMTKATGRTDEALTQIMNTQQKMADLLAQSMEAVNRQIGLTWSNVDIWFKSTELWWKSLIAGMNPNDAVSQFETTMQGFRRAYLNTLIKPVEDETKNKKSLYDTLFSPEDLKPTSDSFSGLLKQVTKFDDLKKYLDVSSQIETVNTNISLLNDAKIAAQSLNYQVKQVTPDMIGNGKTMVDYLNPDDVETLKKGIEATGHRFELTGMVMHDFNNVANGCEQEITKLNVKLGSLQTIETRLRPTVDEVTAAFEDAKTNIEAYGENIIVLNSDINKLNESLPDLKQKLLELTTGTKLDRFQHYANLAAKYGEKYINEFTEVFDEYGNNMSDVIRTIYEYNDALDDEKKATEEAKKANNDLQIAMARNNLEMLKLQLAGMMRRRGNTRAEQRQMKQLEIANTKLRIEEMQNELNITETGQQDVLGAKENAANKAQEILDEYLDSERHNLWLIEDLRDEDIADLKATILEQEGLLNERKTMLETQTTDLAKLQTAYNAVITGIAGNKETADVYKKITGVNIPAEAKNINKQALTESRMTGAKKVMQRMGYFGGVGFQGGTESVPETGFYKLHKYEKVSPAGKIENTGGTSIVVNINNPQISNDYDVAKMARTLENTMRANMIDKRTGKSKYRMM
jgi:TP901 family phage tail tape measure protein